MRLLRQWKSCCPSLQINVFFIWFFRWLLVKNPYPHSLQLRGLIFRFSLRSETIFSPYTLFLDNCLWSESEHNMCCKNCLIDWKKKYFQPIWCTRCFRQLLICFQSFLFQLSCYTDLWDNISYKDLYLATKRKVITQWNCFFLCLKSKY